LKMTTSVKAMDSQRCNCRTHLLKFNGTSSSDDFSQCCRRYRKLALFVRKNQGQ
jgi:hypothetical protein